jgi:hypothetical protein
MTGLGYLKWGVTFDPQFELHGGHLMRLKALSLCVPLWVLAGMFLGDCWRDGKLGTLPPISHTQPSTFHPPHLTLHLYHTHT